MAELLKKFQEENVRVKDDQVMYKIIVHGDQLTEERARNVQWTFKIGDTEAEHFEGFECTFSEFHLKMCLYEGSNIFCGHRGLFHQNFNGTFFRICF